MTNILVFKNILTEFVALDKTLTQLHRIGNQFAIAAHHERWLSILQELKLNWQKDYTMNEVTFRAIWQTGAYQHCIQTIEDYFEFVKKYTELYGKPLEKDTLMYRADDKPIQFLNGSSWTKDKKSAFNFGGRMFLPFVYKMIIPKGTKVIHFYGTNRYTESEDVIHFPSAQNDSLDKFAENKGARILNNGKSRLIFEKTNGCIETHILSSKDTDCMIHRMSQLIAA